jgi:hypothetical protein
MASNNAGSGAELSDNGGDGQTEISDAQVVENSPQPSEAVESLATFTASHGPLDLKVLPNVERGGTDWRIVVYSRGVRGPLLETNQPITDQQASELGISRQLQDRLNEALEYAQAELELPRELGHMTRSKQSLSDLEALMD